MKAGVPLIIRELTCQVFVYQSILYHNYAEISDAERRLEKLEHKVMRRT